MDILNKLINNPGLHHIAEDIICLLDTDTAFETMSKLISDENREFFIRTLRKKMCNRAQNICQKTFEFTQAWPWPWGEGAIQRSIFQMFPYFKEDIKEFRKSECLDSFQKLQENLKLLEKIVANGDCCPRCNGYEFNMSALYEVARKNNQDWQKPRMMRKVLDEWEVELDDLIEWAFDDGNIAVCGAETSDDDDDV